MRVECRSYSQQGQHDTQEHGWAMKVECRVRVFSFVFCYQNTTQQHRKMVSCKCLHAYVTITYCHIYMMHATLRTNTKTTSEICWEKVVQLGVHEAPLYHEHEHMYHQLMPADSRWRLLRFPIPVEFDRHRQEKLKNLFA